MNSLKVDLCNTTLPILTVEKKCYKEDFQIGVGDEASVYKYNDQFAFKIFDLNSNEETLLKKFEKIELLGKLRDPNACFPVGLVVNEDGKKEGYYYELVNFLENFKDFNHLLFLKDTRKIMDYLIKADEAIQRFHKMGITLGDIKGDNIMIDCDGNVKFIDTDNWMYNGYGFDIEPCRIHWLNTIFNGKFSLIDNDKFIFAMMAIQYFIEEVIISLYRSDICFKNLIEFMDVSCEVKDGLRLIFSDAKEKPYIGPILKKIDPEQKILTKHAIDHLKGVFW